jgi:hypothetical protein
MQMELTKTLAMTMVAFFTFYLLPVFAIEGAMRFLEWV